MSDDRTVRVRLMAEVADYIAKMSAAASTTRKFGQEIAQSTKTDAGRRNLDQLTDRTALLGTGLVGVAVAAVKMSADFDKAMSGVEAATHESASGMNQLREAALQAGKDTSFSATQAAKAEEELAKAGVSTKDIIGGGLKGALDLAAAGSLDVGEAAEVAASALTQFGLKGAQVPHVADLIAAGAGKAQGEVHDMALALNQSGLVAAQLGLTVEDTTGALAEFAAAGLVGSDAGTSLKQALLQLVNPSQQAKGLMDEYGISVYDAQGKFVGLSNLAGQLQSKLGRLSEAQRNAALATIFGSDAIRVASILYKDGAKGVDSWKAKVDDSGYAADTAAKKLDNLSGDLEKLKGSLETTLIQSGSGANTALRKIAQGAETIVDRFGALPAPLQQGAVYLSALAGAGLLAFSAAIKLKGKINELQQSLTSLGPAGTKAAGVIGTVGKAAGIVGAVLASIQLVTAAAGYDATTVSLSKLSQSLLNYAKTGEVAGAAQAVLGKNLKTFSTDIKQFRDDLDTKTQHVFESLTGLGSVVDDSLYHAQQRLGQVDQALTDLVTSGHADQAAEAFDRLRKKTIAEGGSLADLKRALPQYAAAIGEMSASQAQSQKTTNDQAAALDLVTGSLKSAIDAVGSLAAVWDELNGKMAGTDSAMLKANKAVDDLKKSLEENGKAFDRNSTAGLENRTALEGLSKAAADAASAKYDETGSVEEARKVWAKYKQQAEDTLVAMGATRAEARRLVNEMFQFPDDITVPVTTPGAKSSANVLADLKRREDALKKKIAIAMSTYGPASAQVAALKRQLAALRNKEIWIRTHYITTTERYTIYRTDKGGRAAVDNADGGIYPHFYAAGGFENHTAQIAARGTPMRIWNEAEPGGEAYIPLDPAKRGRSIPIWEETGRQLGIPIGQLAPATVFGSRGAAGPSAADIGRATAQHLAGPFGVLAEAIQSGRVTSVQINGRELIHAMDDARRDVDLRG